MALSDAERAKQYRERKQRERDGSVTENVTTVTERHEQSVTTQKLKRSDLDVPQLVALARADKLKLTPDEEQRIRDHFGYAPSELRTLKTRDAVAEKIRAQDDGRGLSLTAFPTQTPGLLTPSPSALKKLGETTGSR